MDRPEHGEVAGDAGRLVQREVPVVRYSIARAAEGPVLELRPAEHAKPRLNTPSTAFRTVPSRPPAGTAQQDRLLERAVRAAVRGLSVVAEGVLLLARQV